MMQSHTSPFPGFLSGSSLKVIAIVSMLIDHIGAGFLLFYINGYKPIGITDSAAYAAYSERLMALTHIYQVMRAIGRLAFPIFCFLLVEGFLHTHNVQKYLSRLALFCLLSEVPFDLAFQHKALEFTHQNVFFTLLIGLLVLWGLQYGQAALAADGTRALLVEALSLMAGCSAAYFLKTDYSYIGVLAIVMFYLFRYQPFVGAMLSCILLYISNHLEVYALCTPFLLLFYNGKRGLSLKYFFYAFYPIHLLLIYFCYSLFLT